MKASISLKKILLRYFLKLYTSKPLRKLPQAIISGSISPNATIIISTFERRFFEFTIPLLNSIRTATNIPVTIVINGNFNTVRDENIYRRFVIATQEYPNVNLVTFNTFRGWSSMLNAGILHSDSEVSIVFNDDIYLNPNGLKADLDYILTAIREKHLILLNNSWSHFAISRECLSSIGFFDEHFLGIGQEDGDYAFRFKSHFGFEVPTLNVSGLINFVDQSRDQEVAVTNGKYSLFNNVYLQIKTKAEAELGDIGWKSGSEGSLQSIHSWRTAVYETLGWEEEEAIKRRIEETNHPKYRSN